MIPMTGCALFGANKVLSGIRDAVVLQHSVIGCNWGSLAVHSFQNPTGIRQASTVVYDEDVVYGTEKTLRKAVREAEELYPDSRAIFVISGCVPNLIGDDMEGILASLATEKPVRHYSMPGYGRTFDDGVEKALLSLAEFVKPQPAANTTDGFPAESLAEGLEDIPSVNFIGISPDDPYAAEDMDFLRELMGRKVRVNCALHRCCLADVENMGRSSLNIVFGYGRGLAEALERKCGTPFVLCGYPYGVSGCIAFLERIGRGLQVDFREEVRQLEEEAERLVRKSSYYLSILYGMPVAIMGDKSHLPGMRDFLENELGMDVVTAMECDRGDLDAFEAEVRQRKPSLLVGSSVARPLAERYRIPLVRYTYPVLDELNLSGKTLLGVQGTGLLLEKIVNAALQSLYKNGPTYEGLGHRIPDGEREEGGAADERG